MVTEAYIEKEILPVFANIAPIGKYQTLPERVTAGMANFVSEVRNVINEREREKVGRIKNERKDWSILKRLFTSIPTDSFIYENELHPICVRMGLAKDNDNAKDLI